MLSKYQKKEWGKGYRNPCCISFAQRQISTYTMFIPFFVLPCMFFSVSNVSWHFLLWSVKVGVVYLCKLSLISKFQEEIKKHSATSQEYGNSVHQKWVWYWVCSFAGGSELMEAITAGSTPMHADQWME